MSPFVVAELRRGLGPRHLAAFALGAAIAALNAALVPRLPELAQGFLRDSLRLPTSADLILVNDYLAQHFLVLTVGAFDLIRVYVGPLEARELDLLLAKPISRARFLAARGAPALVAALVLSLALSLVHALTLRAALGEAALAPILAAGALIAALTVALLGLLNLAFLRLREVEHAVLLAFAAVIAPLLPTSLLIYRPDLFTGPALSPWTAFPASLLWQGGPGLAAGLLALLAAAALAAALLALAARRLDRRPDL